MKTEKKNQIQSSIDMRLTKNDVIEMLVAEQEEKLRKALDEKDKVVCALNKEIPERVYNAFAKANKKIINDMQKTFGVTNMTARAWDKEVRVTLSNPTNSYMYVNFSIPMDDDDVAVLKDNYQELQKLRDEMLDFHKSTKAAKVKLTRQLLEQSEEGQRILENLKVITVSLPEPKK